MCIPRRINQPSFVTLASTSASHDRVQSVVQQRRIILCDGDRLLRRSTSTRVKYSQCYRVSTLQRECAQSGWTFVLGSVAKIPLGDQVLVLRIELNHVWIGSRWRISEFSVCSRWRIAQGWFIFTSSQCKYSNHTEKKHFY